MTAHSRKKSISKAKDKTGASQKGADASLRWPPLRPLVPTSDLRLDVVLPDQIVLIRKLFTKTLCEQYVSFLATLPLVTTPGKPKKGDALRVNDRFQVDDAQFAEMLWTTTSLEDLVVDSKLDWGGEVCGLNPRIRVYRYGKGQFFDQHYDESNTLLLPTDPPTSAKTTWTLLIYLTGPTTGCVGGETAFYPEHGTAKKYTEKNADSVGPVVVDLEVGMALLHKHGNDCLLHEGREVLEGEKWVIRSDLCVTG